MNNGGGGPADNDDDVSSYEPSEDDVTEYDELFRSGFPSLFWPPASVLGSVSKYFLHSGRPRTGRGDWRKRGGRRRRRPSWPGPRRRRRRRGGPGRPRRRAGRRQRPRRPRGGRQWLRQKWRNRRSESNDHHVAAMMKGNWKTGWK